LDRTTGPTINVKTAIAHENYDPVTLNNDIGLLILTSPIPKCINSKPIKITEEKDAKPGSTITVSGWGGINSDGKLSTYLKVAKLTVVERSICNALWLAAPPVDGPSPVTNNMICGIDAVNSQCFVSITQ
jgi:trypsin